MHLSFVDKDKMIILSSITYSFGDSDNVHALGGEDNSYIDLAVELYKDKENFKVYQHKTPVKNKESDDFILKFIKREIHSVIIICRTKKIFTENKSKFLDIKALKDV